MDKKFVDWIHSSGSVLFSMFKSLVRSAKISKGILVSLFLAEFVLEQKAFCKVLYKTRAPMLSRG